MHFRSTHNFLLKICSCSRRRAAQASGSTHAARYGRAERGTTLIDVIVGSALMLLVFMGIAAVFQLSVDVVTNNKSRAGAIALGNERMEYIRSLEYAQIGTVGGIPSGAIAPIETITLNGATYTRRTYIEYADDPGDGVGAADQNGITVDYKAVRVNVSWTSRIGERHLTFLTRIEPQNGMEVSCSVPCGTLSIAVVNAAAAPVSSAQVRIVNASTTPTIDVTTYTNTQGVADLVGAPVASNYQITVSKSGYNSAQTYAQSAGNPNPNPGHLAVAQNQTTSATFSIDLTATKTVYTFTQILAGSWGDTMSDSSYIASSTAISIASGFARLSGAPGSYPSWGELQGLTFNPSTLYRWKTLSWVGSTPPGTDLRFHVYQEGGTALIPDAALPGNSVGFDGSVDLTGISTSTYPAIRVAATLTSSNPSVTPSLDSYALLYDYGPLSLPGVSFNMRGEKTIGNGPPAIYKYNATSTTDSYGRTILGNFEWDTYTVSVYPSSGYDVASACFPQPEYLVPGSSASTRFYLAPHTANSLQVEVRSQATSALLEGTTVALSKVGYAATSTTDSCGQTFFGGLSNASYLYSISKSGYQATSSLMNVSGNATLKVNLQ